MGPTAPRHRGPRAKLSPTVSPTREPLQLGDDAPGAAAFGEVTRSHCTLQPVIAVPAAAAVAHLDDDLCVTVGQHERGEVGFGRGQCLLGDD
jgi:hypothetical protein